MSKEKKTSWFAGPYTWLISTFAFLLPAINYFRKGDTIGGAIFSVSAAMFFVNFLGRLKRN